MTKRLLRKLDKEVAKIIASRDNTIIQMPFNDPVNLVSAKYYKKIRKLWWFEYKAIKPAIDAKATEEGLLKDGHSTRMGACHGIWAIEKHMMKEKYNIDWYTLPDINPGTMYD